MIGNLREILKSIIGKNNHSQDIIKGFSKLERFGFQQMGQFTDSDVFIIGYPKSGNTLLQFLIAYLVYGLRRDAPVSLINSCVTEFYNNPYFYRFDKRHFFKSHELPHPDYKKVLYIVRDGRDAVRSYYYMRKNMGKEISINELYLNGGETFVGNWSNHISKWLENPYNADILFIRYEDLLTNKKYQIDRICEFLKLERSNFEIEQSVFNSSFENMKITEESLGWQRIKDHLNWKKSGNFVREGESGNFNHDAAIDNAVLDYFTNISKDNLLKFNYDL